MNPRCAPPRQWAQSVLYVRELLAAAGMAQGATAMAIGISTRMMRFYSSRRAERAVEAPYVVQFALGALAGTQRPVAPAKGREALRPSSAAHEEVAK